MIVTDITMLDSTRLYCNNTPLDLFETYPSQSPHGPVNIIAITQPLCPIDQTNIGKALSPEHLASGFG